MGCTSHSRLDSCAGPLNEKSAGSLNEESARLW